MLEISQIGNPIGGTPVILGKLSTFYGKSFSSPKDLVGPLGHTMLTFLGGLYIVLFDQIKYPNNMNLVSFFICWFKVLSTYTW